MPPTNTTIGARLGPYRIEALVGEGGMAAVYRAVHTDLGSMHAIKVLTVPTTVIRARLLQEGRIQARLDHPNVVRVTGTVEVDGGPALVLDFVDGPDLGRILHGWRPTLDQVDFIARGVLAGAGAAHAIGSIHRDLKPANILLDLSSGEPAIKVADFGIAKLLNEASAGLSRTGAAMGTPAYMSPEQARGADDLDPRSDVFSLGCILYELLTGQRAFDGRNALTVMRSVMSSTPVPAETLAPDAPARMHRAIAAALHKNRAERPADAAALCALWTDDGAAPPPVNPWDDRAREAVSQLRKAPPPLLTDAATLTFDDLATTAPEHATQADNLPPRKRMVGRDPAPIVAALGDAARVVTLVGPAGVGTSTLAIEVARAVAGRYPGGAWLIPLSGVADAPGLALAVASVLGLPGPGAAARRRREPMARSLARHLAARPPTLLVFEDVAKVRGILRGTVAGLLRGAPNVVVLCAATARLGLPSERVVSVEPLDDGLLPHDAPPGWEAVVGGRPLAAELVRALLPHTTPEATPPPELPELIRRAWRAAPATTALATLARTPGPWTAETAAAMLGILPPWEDWVAAGLVERRSSCWAMHPTVRETLAGEPAPAPLAAAVAAIDADDTTLRLELATRLALASDPLASHALLAGLLELPESEWIAPIALARLRDQILSNPDLNPLAHVLAAGCATTLAHPAAAQLTTEAQRQVERHPDPGVRAPLWARLTLVSGQDTQACLAAARADTLRAPHTGAAVSDAAARVATRANDHAAAESLDRAQLARPDLSPRLALAAHARLAHSLAARGQPGEAHPMAMEAAALARVLGRWAEGLSMAALAAQQALERGALVQAADTLNRTLPEAQRIGRSDLVARLLLSHGWLALARGQGDRAWAQLSEAGSLARRGGEREVAAGAAAALAHVRIGRGVPRDAIDPLATALREALGLRHGLVCLWVARCRALAAIDDPAGAAAASSAASDAARDLPPNCTEALLALAAEALAHPHSDALDRLESRLANRDAPAGVRLSPLIADAVAAAPHRAA